MEGNKVILTPIPPYFDRFLISGRSMEFASLMASPRAAGDGCVRAVSIPSPPALETALANLGRPTHFQTVKKEIVRESVCVCACEIVRRELVMTLVLLPPLLTCIPP